MNKPLTIVVSCEIRMVTYFMSRITLTHVISNAYSFRPRLLLHLFHITCSNSSTLLRMRIGNDDWL